MKGQFTTRLEEKRESAMQTLNGALANVCSLLMITIALMQFNRNAPCKF